MTDKMKPEPAILVDEPRRLPPHANCGSCFYGRLEPGPDGTMNIQNRTCYRAPPSVFAVPQQVQQFNKMTGQTEIAMAVQIMTMFPTVNVKQRCHDWAPTDKDVIAGIGMIGGATGSGKTN
jgi:hypothetical protein